MNLERKEGLKTINLVEDYTFMSMAILVLKATQESNGSGTDQLLRGNFVRQVRILRNVTQKFIDFYKPTTNLPKISTNTASQASQIPISCDLCKISIMD